MTTITVHEIERDPLRYLQRVEAGETLLVVRGDRPVAEIKPVGAPAGVPDDFDAPLPESTLGDFEGRSRIA